MGNNLSSSKINKNAVIPENNDEIFNKKISEIIDKELTSKLKKKNLY